MPNEVEIEKYIKELEKENERLQQENNQLKEDKKKAKKYIDEEILFEDMFGEGEDTFLEDVNTKYYKGLKELLGEKENE